MTEIEKIKQYIERYGAPRNARFDANVAEIFAIAKEMPTIEGITFAFTYGKAKGYRAAKAKIKTKEAI